jgi:serine/threonine-protein kinase HipA
VKNKNIRQIEVKLWDMPMGQLAIDDDGIGYFRYHDEFILTGLNPAPIRMPVKKGISYSFPNLNPETFKGLPGMISDSLPDAFGDKLLDIYFKKQGVKQRANIQLLKLCYVSHKAIGALEFVPSLQIDGQSQELKLDELSAIVDKLISSKKGITTGDLNQIQGVISIASSLGGAAPKGVLGINFETDSIKPGNIELPEGYEYWIIKFDAIKQSSELLMEQSLGFTNVEYVYSLMAKEAGIHMTDCKLIKDKERQHFLTKRFDRIDGNKIHVQTLHAIAHMDSYDIWDIDLYFRTMTRLKLAYHDHEQMYRRVVFNALAGNTDTHTKNTSFMMDESGNWKLTPCYDIICSVSMKHKSTENHKTTINGKRKDFQYEDLIAVAEGNGIRKADKIISEVVESLSNWSQLADQNNVRAEYKEHVQNIITNNLKNIVNHERYKKHKS